MNRANILFAETYCAPTGEISGGGAVLEVQPLRFLCAKLEHCAHRVGWLSAVSLLWWQAVA